MPGISQPGSQYIAYDTKKLYVYSDEGKPVDLIDTVVFPAEYEIPASYLATGITVDALDVDWSLGIHFIKVMGENTVLTFSNVTEGKTITLEVSGNYTLTLPTGVSVDDLADFNGAETNYIQLYCANADTPIYLAALKSRA